MNILRFSILFCTAIVPLTCGCTIGPDYRPPDLNIGQGWSIEEADSGEAALDCWWQSFGDPTLNRLVERAAFQNLDIRQAGARVREARALYSAATGRALPVVDASGSVTIRRQSENGPLPVGRITGLERDQTIYETGFDALWEADLFGGIRRGVEASRARLDETVAMEQSARLQVVAEVVRRYVELRQSQQELELQKEIIDASSRTHALVQYQFLAGEVTSAALSQSAAQLKIQEAKLPAIQEEIRIAALALGVLVGDLPESQLPLAYQEPWHLELVPLPVGVRADVLRRRPDVLAAEYRLAAATAEIGQTTAELFPKMVIGAGGGFQALSAADLLQGSSLAWHITPLISWRIFEGGRIKAQIHAREAAAERSALAYEQAVLQALNDAEQALTRYLYGLESIELQRQAVREAKENLSHMEVRYRAGDISLFELLEAQQQLYFAQSSLSRLQRRTAVSLVALYKSLGGGWQQYDAPMADDTILGSKANQR